MKNQRLKFKKVEEEVVVPAINEEKVVKKAGQKLKDPFIFKQSLIERITADLFIGAILLSLLIKSKLSSTLNGELKKQSGSISAYYINYIIK